MRFGLVILIVFVTLLGELLRRLSPFFDCGGGLVVDPHALQQFCHSCVRGGINGQIKDFRESGLPDEEKSAKTNKLHARFSSWSPEGRRVSGVAVLGK